MNSTLKDQEFAGGNILIVLLLDTLRANQEFPGKSSTYFVHAKSLINTDKLSEASLSLGLLAQV